MSKSKSPAHKAWRERQKAKREALPDTSITCDEAGARGVAVWREQCRVRREAKASRTR